MAGKLPEGVIWRTINGARVALNPKTGRVVAGAGGKLTGRQLTWYDDMGKMPASVKRAGQILAKAVKRQQHEAINTPEKQALADSMLGAIDEARRKRGPIGDSGTERGDRNAMAQLDAIESRLKAGKLTDVDRESIREPLERFGVRRRVVSAAEPWVATPDLYASDKYGYQGHMDMGPDAARRMRGNKTIEQWQAQYDKANDAINSAQWKFNFTKRAAPPSSAEPDAYQARREAKAALRYLRRQAKNEESN